MNRQINGVKFDTFEQLEDGLRKWRSFIDPDVYDVAGMMALFCACIENLQNNTVDDEVADLGMGLTDQQRTFLEMLTKK